MDDRWQRKQLQVEATRIVKRGGETETTELEAEAARIARGDRVEASRRPAQGNSREGPLAIANALGSDSQRTCVEHHESSDRNDDVRKVLEIVGGRDERAVF